MTLAVAVGDLGGLPETEGVAAGFGVDIDDDGVDLSLAETADRGLEVGLILFGDVVLGVLLEVAPGRGAAQISFSILKRRSPFGVTTWISEPTG